MNSRQPVASASSAFPWAFGIAGSEPSRLRHDLAAVNPDAALSMHGLPRAAIGDEVSPVSGRRLRVAIVEDSDNIRERLVQLVEDDRQMQVVGEADTEVRAVAMCRACEPDAVILDLKLASGTGIGVLKTMGYATAAQKPTIIVLTNFPLPAFARAARALGADWFLDKTSEFHKLRDLLRGLL